jgi:hypothetical protein
MGDGIVRIVNELDEQSTFQMALIAFCPLGFLADQRKAKKNNPQRPWRLCGELLQTAVFSPRVGQKYGKV